MSFIWGVPLPTIQVDDIESTDRPLEYPARTKTEYYTDEKTGEIVSVFTGQAAANLVRDLIREQFDMGRQSTYYKVPGEPDLVDDLPEEWFTPA